MKCGKEHFAKDCPLKSGLGTSLEKHQLDCANCGEHHTANYSKCKVRTAYNESMNVSRTRRIMPARPSRPEPQLQNFELPDRFGPKPWTTRTTNHHTTSNSIDGLLPPEVIVEVFNDLFSNLRNCRTAQEQIMAIGKTVSKFIYYNP